MNAILEQLPWRVKNVHRDPHQTSYALFVYCRRVQLGLKRVTLSTQAGIASDRLAFLENALLMPGELTQEETKRIESALGISYNDFMEGETNRRLLAKIGQYKFVRN